MFNLMSNCCNWVSSIQQPMRKVTVLVVGLDKAGKTSCVRGMLRTPTGDVGPTQGCVCNELRVENMLVNLLDVGGGPEARVSWSEYYAQAHGIIFVVDSSDRQRMTEVRGLLTDMLRHPRVAGKPLLVLANKQDKMSALLGIELIEILSLEKLVNRSRSLCHIESCSALMDARQWSDRKTLRGITWLLRAVCLDYSELCTRVIGDLRRPPGAEDRERRGNRKKRRKKNKDDRVKASDMDFSQGQAVLEIESNRTAPQPIRDVFQMSSLKTKLKTKRKVGVKIKSQNDEEEEDAEGHKAEQQDHSEKEQASSTLLPRRRGKLKCNVKLKEETLARPGSLSDPITGNEQEKQGKVVKGKRRNKINTEKILAAYTQPTDLSATFALYRKALLALKGRQDQRSEKTEIGGQKEMM
uniref:ADP-ribosylation factor-like 13A n=1 Tax=Electrophorus electricus TaxID=8005 RepID=A0A4W4GGT0_ELEEL